MRKLLVLSLLTSALLGFEAQDYSKLIGMPGFTDELLKTHFQLYQGYVKNATLLADTLKQLEQADKAMSYEYSAQKRRFNWEFNGMRLHELYFTNLGGNGVLDPNAPLYGALTKEFGSYDKWKKAFIATGSMRGIGWTILYKDLTTGRLMNIWIEDHDLGTLAGAKPLLIMDVFEHAYMPQFGLDRAAYIDAFFKNINWSAVSSRLTP
jgi:Fe-Mn family superoxide dismutase